MVEEALSSGAVWLTHLIALQQAEAAPAQLANIPKVEMDPSSIAAYVSDIMAGFTAAQPPLLLPGQDPLSLEGYLALERARPTVPDAQHIFNKLVYDAANEALLHIYTQANRLKVRSCAESPVWRWSGAPP
jgi:hypothetical protein